MIREEHRPSLNERAGGSSREDGNINSKERNFLEGMDKKLESVSYEQAKELLKNYRN